MFKARIFEGGKMGTEPCPAPRFPPSLKLRQSPGAPGRNGAPVPRHRIARLCRCASKSDCARFKRRLYKPGFSLRRWLWTHASRPACPWSRWSAPGKPDLLSFAAITNEPPPEVAAAGHERCIVPIKPENLDA